MFLAILFYFPNALLVMVACERTSIWKLDAGRIVQSALPLVHVNLQLHQCTALSVILILCGTTHSDVYDTSIIFLD